MKIAIIGTHSTGKTTLLTALTSYLKNTATKNVICVREIARECPFPINENTSIDAQTWILQKQIEKEKLLHTTGTMLLCDRATLDNFAYLLRIATHKNINVDHLEAIAAAHMQSYDFIFKTNKLALPATNDGIRSTDDMFRDEIDDSINALLHKNNIAHQILEAHTDTARHVSAMTEKIFENTKEVVGATSCFGG